MRSAGAPTVLSVSLLLLATLAGATNPPDGYVFKLTTARHRYTVVTAQEVDTKLAGASMALRLQSASCYDQTCCVVLERKNALETMDVNDAYDYIYADSELAEVEADPRNIKVVTYMENVAGRQGRVIGVTTIGTRNTVIVYNAYATAWAHEFGHMKGLGEYNECDSYIMNIPTEETDDAVNVTHCGVFMQYPDEMRYHQCATAVGTSFVATGDSRSVRLAWSESDPSWTGTYTIRRGESCWGPPVRIAEISAGDPMYTPDGTNYSFIDVGATTLQTHFYQLSTGQELLQASAAPTNGDPAYPPGRPTGLAARTYWGDNGRPTVNLEWTGSSGSVTGYYVYRAEYAGMDTCNSTKTYLGAATSPSWLDAGANTSGIPIFYRVRAYNVTCGSDVSDEVSVHRRSIAFRVLANVSGAVMSDNGAAITVGAEGYAPPCSVFAESSRRVISVDVAQQVNGTRYLSLPIIPSGGETA